VQALTLAADASTASEGKDYAAASAKLEEAVAIRPDMSQLLEKLAAAYVAAERLEEAEAALQRLASLGVGAAIEKAPEYAVLAARKQFQTVAKQLAANLHPKGSGEVAFTLRDVTGLFEGMAWHENTGEFLFADVNGRAIWARKKDGGLRRLTEEGADLLGVFAIAIDEANGTVWAATAAVDAMQGFTAELNGTAALAEIDLATGALRQTIAVPTKRGEEHVLSAVAIAPNGAVLATDARSGTLWQYVPGAKALSVAVESAEFLSLQGLVVLPGNVVLIADHTSGLWRVDLGTGAVQRLDAPGTTLVGLDSLTLAADGAVIAVQNGIRPNRVLRLALDDTAETITGVTVLEAGHLAMAAPSSGCVGPAGDFHFIGTPGWNRFSTGSAPSAPRPLPIFRAKLPKAKK
jgi:hypothetical protein